MQKYILDIVPGTKDFVLAELISKFPQVENVDAKYKHIAFDSIVEDVDDFRTLKSALRILKLHGPQRNLYRRKWKVETAAAGINPALAYILCQIASVTEEDVVLDPFCGAGTIAITAAKYFKAKKVLASDVSGKAIDLIVTNIKAANLPKNSITAFRSNVTQLKFSSDSVDKIITNPPFGVRVGNHEENVKIYTSLANKSFNILKKGGKVVVITQEKLLIREAFKKFKLEMEQEIEQGGLKPNIFLFVKN